MLDGLCCKKERSWVKCGTKGKEDKQSPKVLGPMSLQHSSAMFMTKNGPTTRIISINSWLWQPRIAHVMTNLAGTGMQIRWFKPNHWVSSVSEAHRLMFLSISCLICCWSLANVVFSILPQKNGKHSMAGNLPSPIRSASSLRSARRNDHTRCFRPSDAHQ